MRKSTGSALILFLALSIAPAAAQDSMVAPAGDPVDLQVRDVQRAPVRPWGLPTSRPAALPVLYVGYGALQTVDLWQTASLVRGGAREVNPVMAGATGSTAAMIAVKAATTAGTFYFVERLWKNDHRLAAVLTMAAVTGVSAAVVAHNARQSALR